jgi:hypothetical protein
MKNQLLRLPRRISVAPGSTLSVQNKNNPGRHSGKEGETDGIRLKIVPRACVDFSELDYSLLAHRAAQVCEDVFGQLPSHHFLMRFIVGVGKHLC